MGKGEKDVAVAAIVKQSIVPLTTCLLLVGMDGIDCLEKYGRTRLLKESFLLGLHGPVMPILINKESVFFLELIWTAPKQRPPGA
jgi:hypothetical protein